MIRLERHEKGPRVRVLGQRVHECHLGMAVLAGALLGRFLGLWHDDLATSLGAAIGIWLILKDLRDLIPRHRDTASWRVGFHRRTAPLRAMRRADGLPALAGGATFVLGLVNLLSALTPDVAWRDHLLLQIEPVETVPVFHTLAVPTSVALMVTAMYLQRRRRRAVYVSIALLALLGAFSVLKGLDFEEAILSWLAAAGLWLGRDAFCVRHGRLRKRAFGIVAVAGGTALLTSLAAWVMAGRPGGPLVTFHEAFALLTWTEPAIGFPHSLAWLPSATGLLGLLAIVGGAWIAFRPLEPPNELPGAGERQAALELVRAHGRDTLAFFKLRKDVHYLFSSCSSAFLAYRIENGVLLVSGDPVGPAAALPELVRETCAFAETRGLRVGAVGASELLVGLWRKAGLRSLYVGDEAIVDTGEFSLEGRAIRKVRQSVARLEKAGFSSSIHELDSIDASTLVELEHVAERWRDGACERGFSMAMDSLRGEHQEDSVVILARDEEGTVRAFLHFVPTNDRKAMSLSLMCRERATPNGLTEYLVVQAIELLRVRGIEELSLNFAAFARLLDRPSGRLERVLGRVVSLGNPFFQIESLYRFNAKFFPRWEPRYLIYEGRRGLLRTGLAALVVEGQLQIPLP